MFILTVKGKEDDGAYSVANEHGVKVLYIFEEEDDATRFSIMLEDNNYPEMNVLEVEDQLLLHTCEQHEYNYAIITKNDLVIPPK
tara:strand:+ start:9523 stop:9777 length:255 start_codon:yes stop_codon:yes gene_type:complete